MNYYVLYSTFGDESALGKLRSLASRQEAKEVLSKVVDGGNEKGGVPLVKSHRHQTCQQGKGVRHREPVYLRDLHRAIAGKP
jgi:hypothetical protein